jgi:hypothetical protein
VSVPNEEEPELPSPGFRVEYNADGSAIVKLEHPVAWKGEQIERLTIPRITGRLLRRAQWSLEHGANMGDVIGFAADVVEPVGVLDELDAFLARGVALEVMHALGKSRRGGAARSPT